MPGFPNRPPRPAFGPEMQNVREPVIPEKDLAANQMNLTFWQAAGAGRTVPMAVILYDGVATSVLFQVLAFDPKQELGDIAIVRGSAGVYTATFASTYKDEQGADVPFTPRASMVALQNGAVGSKANVFIPSGQDVLVQVRDSGEVLIDGTFLLAVW